MKNKGLKSELEEAEQQLDESEVMIGCLYLWIWLVVVSLVMICFIT